MKDYSVNIELHRGWHSNVEAGTSEEAVQKALEEWPELAMVDEEDLDISVVEFHYDDTFDH